MHTLPARPHMQYEALTAATLAPLTLATVAGRPRKSKLLALASHCNMLSLMLAAYSSALALSCSPATASLSGHSSSWLLKLPLLKNSIASAVW